jgi:hypothetical protein
MYSTMGDYRFNRDVNNIRGSMARLTRRLAGLGAQTRTSGSRSQNWSSSFAPQSQIAISVQVKHCCDDHRPQNGTRVRN